MTLYADQFRDEHGDYVDEDGCSHDAAAGWWASHFGLCACGDRGAVLGYLRDVARLIGPVTPTSEFIRESGEQACQRAAATVARRREFFGGNDAAMWLAYNVLSSAGMTEHGSCLPGWLTPLGEAFVRDVDAMEQGGTLDD